MKKLKVVITRPLHDNPIVSGPLSEFCKKFDVWQGAADGYINRDELKKVIVDADAVLSQGHDHINKEIIELAPNLKVIANFGAGYDTVDVKFATERGVWVCNTPAPTTAATADLALGLLLSATRNMVQGDAYVKAGLWEKNGENPLMFWGNSPQNKTIGIIGFGNIGQALARRVAPLEMNILYYRRTRLDEKEEQALGVKYATMEELLKESDYISIHTPLNETTRYLLDTKEFELMKPGVYIINTARGAVIREEALVEALKSGKVRGAGLDVFEREPKPHPDLLTMPNVTLLPHIGTATVEARSAMFNLCVANAEAVLEGRAPLTPVNEVGQKKE